MDSVEFSVARIRMLVGGEYTPEFLAEIAFLYDHIVKTGTHEPVIDLGRAWRILRVVAVNV